MRLGKGGQDLEGLEQGYSARRRAVDILNDMQRGESNAVESVWAISAKHKRRLLTCFCDWLTECSSRPQDIAEVSRATGVDLAEWHRITARVEELARAADDAASAEQRAKAAYREVAPGGPLSKVLASAEVKAEIDRRQRAGQEAKAKWQSARTSLGAARGEVRAWVEHYLERCLEKADELRHLPSMRAVRVTLDEWANEVNGVWDAERARQSELVDELERLTHGFRERIRAVVSASRR